MLKPEDKVLLDAADLLEEKGWTQGKYVDPNTGAHCVTGAIKKVSDDDNYAQAQSKLAVYIAETCGVTPVNWNDGSGQTAENVITTVRRVATK